MYSVHMSNLSNLFLALAAVGACKLGWEDMREMYERGEIGQPLLTLISANLTSLISVPIPLGAEWLRVPYPTLWSMRHLTFEAALRAYHSCLCTHEVWEDYCQAWQNSAPRFALHPYPEDEPLRPRVREFLELTGKLEVTHGGSRSLQAVHTTL